jgi:prepilin-type N-terminal cleavage/methylation domain-containing protein
MKWTSKGTTLLELLIALVVMGLVIFGFYNIQLFSDFQVVTSTRKSVLQNEAVYVLEHMGKQMGRAVSNGNVYPVTVDASGNALRVWVDSSRDGQLQTSGSPHDTLVSYVQSGAGRISYCSDTNSSTFVCDGNNETLATHILSSFNATYVNITNSTSYVGITVRGCWDPLSPTTCGGIKNPSATFKTRIGMPSVSSLP